MEINRFRTIGSLSCEGYLYKKETKINEKLTKVRCCMDESWNHRGRNVFELYC